METKGTVLPVREFARRFNSDRPFRRMRTKESLWDLEAEVRLALHCEGSCRKGKGRADRAPSGLGVPQRSMGGSQCGVGAHGALGGPGNGLCTENW